MTPPPSQPQPLDDRFEQLAAGYFDQTLTDAQLARFQQMLREDDACVRRFAELAQLNQMIGQEVVDQQRHILVAGSLDPEDASDTGVARVLMELAHIEAQATPQLVTLDAPTPAPAPGPAASAARGSAKGSARTSATENAPAPHNTPAPLSPQEIASATGYLLGQALTSRPARRAYAYAAAALVLLAAVWLIPWNDNTPPPQTTQQQPSRTATPARPVIATLTNTHNAQWAPGPAASAARETARANPSPNPTPGTPLHPGTRLTLTQGFAEITTVRGAVVILEAPATIELTDSDNALHLHTGKLVGICETDSSKGFVVRTPQLDVIDISTRFGVNVVRDGNVEVSVLAGEVEAQPVAFDTEPIRLAHGRSVVFDRQGQGQSTAVKTAFVQELPGSAYEVSALSLGAVAYFRMNEPLSDPDELEAVVAVNGWESHAEQPFEWSPAGIGVGPLPADAGRSLALSGETGVKIKTGASSGPHAGSDYTIAFWIRPENAAKHQNILTLTTGFGPLRDFSNQLRLSDQGQLIHYVNHGAGDNSGNRDLLSTQYGNAQIPANQWTHVVMSCSNRGQLRLYVNGIEDADPVAIEGELMAGTHYMISGPARTRISTIDTISVAEGFRGALDELAFFDRQLSDAQVASLYRAARADLQAADGSTQKDIDTNNEKND